jgi:hypothetical protein
MIFGTVSFPRPVLATTPDFSVSANPAKVIIPLGYWAETMLTFTSLNGFTGTIQLTTVLGPDTGLVGAGFSTGMTLSPDGSANTDLQLTPGSSTGDYTLIVNATIGSMTHTLPIPITVSPISGPDFITRTWGSYSTLQSWNIAIPQQLVGIGGFKGQVTTSATITPNIPNAPAISFRPSNINLIADTQASYDTVVSTARTTPIGNYIVAISVSSGTASHVYRAIIMVGDYRPQPEEPSPGNSTTTNDNHSSPGSAANNLTALDKASSALSSLQSMWWLQVIIGFSIVTMIVSRKRLSLK